LIDLSIGLYIFPSRWLPTTQLLFVGADILKKVFADEQQVFDLVYSPSERQQAQDLRKDDIKNKDDEETCSSSAITRDQAELLFELVKAERTTQVHNISAAVRFYDI